MWVVKLGGSLNSDPLLPQWLELLANLGGGRVTLVCGGGAFADEVRRAQSQWRFDDLPAHNMAVLAMAQTAYLAHGLQPELRLATSKADICSGVAWKNPCPIARLTASPGNHDCPTIRSFQAGSGKMPGDSGTPTSPVRSPSPNPRVHAGRIIGSMVFSLYPMS